jgi:hypothetical protein
VDDHRDHDRDRLNAMAVAIMAAGTFHQLADDANELAALVRETLRPLPTLPLDAAEREAAFMGLLLEARDRSRRLLALVSS